MPHDPSDAARLLAPFVARGDVRSYLNSTFFVDSDLAACNGHALCVLSGAGTGITPDLPANLANLANIARQCRDFSGDLIDASTITWDAADATCKRCNGTGRVTIEQCKDCDGEGAFEHGRHSYACKECGGYGEKTFTGDATECPDCAGIGIRSGANSSLNDGYETLAARYAKLLQGLPGCQVAPQAVDKRYYFQFSGGYGCVMSMMA